MLRKISVLEICNALSLEYMGKNIVFDGLNLCNRKSKYQSILSYVTSTEYVDDLLTNEAVTGLVLSKDECAFYKKFLDKKIGCMIICDDPEKTFYDIHEFLYHNTDFYDKHDFPSKVGNQCSIHETAVIEKGVIIGNNVIIGPNTVIRKGTVIKDNVIIGCNSTIGSEGFQVLRIDGINRRIVHCGGVFVHENACIGDNVAIGNALFEGYTAIGKNSKIDNLVYVAHNVHIGENVVITAGVAICGSAIIDANAWLGVNSCVLNRVTIGENSKIGMGSVVTRDIMPDKLAYGNPAKIKR